jgi:hypothetical protein
MVRPKLERDAFRAGSEFGWTRAPIPAVVRSIVFTHYLRALTHRLPAN